MGIRVLSFVTILVALGGLGCTVDGEDVVGDGAARVRGPSSPEPGGLSESEILAMRLLMEEERKPSYEWAVVRDLSDEVSMALGVVRASFPGVRGIHARPEWAVGEVVLSTSRELASEVAKLVEDLPSGKGTYLDTSFKAFDELSAEMGARAVRLADPDLRMVVLFFGRLSDPEVISERYVDIDGVYRGSPNRVVGDGPDVLVKRRGSIWKFSFRDGSGDCPSGCLNVEWRFFSVSSGRVRELTRSEAAADGGFSGL